MEEVIPDADHPALQHLLSESAWSEQAVFDQVTQDANRLWGGQADSRQLIDESGCPKKGTQSVGVARQGCGPLGKVENDQVGGFAALSRGTEVRCVNHGLLFHSSLLASTRLPKGTAWFSPLKFPTGGELYADEATACSPRSHALSASVTFRPTGGRFLRTAKILK
ncbi:MAG: transposase [Candidatus Competibacteraceae bacterium]|nr:transposase [Candidatus Competibacteraceae bacterium]MBK8751310.1 transposase [Candidatus Competibacteraceae bacterium]